MAYKEPRVIPISQEKRKNLEARNYLPYVQTKELFHSSLTHFLFGTQKDFSYDPETFSFSTFYQDIKHTLDSPLSEELKSLRMSLNFHNIETLLTYMPFAKIDDGFRFIHDTFNDSHVTHHGRHMNIIDIAYHYNEYIVGYDFTGRPIFTLNGLHFHKNLRQDNNENIHSLSGTNLLCYPEEGEEHLFYTMPIQLKFLAPFCVHNADFVRNQYVETYRFHDIEAEGPVLKQQHLSLFMRKAEDRFESEYMVRAQTLYQVGQPILYQYVTRSGVLKQSEDDKWHNYRITAHPIFRDIFRDQYRQDRLHYFPSVDIFDHPVFKYTGFMERLEHYAAQIKTHPGYSFNFTEGRFNHTYHLPITPTMRFSYKDSVLANKLITSYYDITPKYFNRTKTGYFSPQSSGALHPSLVARLHEDFPDILQFTKEQAFTFADIHRSFHSLQSEKAQALGYVSKQTEYIRSSKIRSIVHERLNAQGHIHLSFISNRVSYSTLDVLESFNQNRFMNPFLHLKRYMTYYSYNPAIEQAMKDPMTNKFAQQFYDSGKNLMNPHAKNSYDAFNISKTLLRTVAEIDRITGIYQARYRETNVGPNRRYSHNSLFSYASDNISNLGTYKRYFENSEQPSQRFFDSVKEFYDTALETNNTDSSLLQAIISCMHQFSDETGQEHLLCLRLGSYVNYMRHALQYQAMSLRHFNTEFNDYLSMKVKIHKSTDFDYYPRPSLRLAHDVALRDFNLIKQEVQRENFKKCVARYADILSFEPKKNPLIFLAPKEPEEVIEEGKNLRHCVGSYVSRISDGQTYIMFLRHKDRPNESVFTIEVDRNFSILQRQGTIGENGPFIKDAINQYAKYLRENASTFLQQKEFSTITV